MTKLPELEGGGGYLIGSMPERKRAFPYEVFPNSSSTFLQGRAVLRAEKESMKSATSGNSGGGSALWIFF